MSCVLYASQIFHICTQMFHTTQTYTHFVCFGQAQGMSHAHVRTRDEHVRNLDEDVRADVIGTCRHATCRRATH
jgi:hypothetical protein